MPSTYYGKRNPGLLTAASPGDTLFFDFESRNDSGDSEALSGFAVGDIEVFKDGAATARATDSGYSLISDTGMMGNRAGLYRFRIQLFNTADDASFYAAGSWYHVAVDSVTIDGRTVRTWVGSFEIGEPRANVVQIDGDTGFADRLGKFASVLSDAGQIDTGTGAADTGALNQTVWQANAARSITNVGDTGIVNSLARIRSDVDTGLRTHISDVDTGLHDTLSDYDTGLRGILITTGVNLGRIRGDTGGADRFYRYTQKLDTGGDASGASSASVDTGQINQAVWQANAVRGITAISDTGLNDRLSRIQSDVDTGLRVHIDDLDTGLHSILQSSGVLVSAISDTGVNARLGAIQTKTDNLTFTVAGQVDANIQYVNDVQVAGTGDTGAGTPWVPA